MNKYDSDVLEPAVLAYTNRQALFLRYFTAILIDLVVLNLFMDYSDKVQADSFTITLFAAVLLQILLRLTIALEHRVAAYFNSKEGGLNKFLRYFTAWLILFGSKFVILEAINLAFGDSLRFSGRFDGLVALIIVLVAMLAAEELVARIYRRLA